MSRPTHTSTLSLSSPSHCERCATCFNSRPHGLRFTDELSQPRSSLRKRTSWPPTQGRPPQATHPLASQPQTHTGGGGRGLTRLRFKVFQVYFIFIFIYVLVPAHHHNGKFKLEDKNENSSVNSGCQDNSHLRHKSQGCFTCLDSRMPPAERLLRAQEGRTFSNSFSWMSSRL